MTECLAHLGKLQATCVTWGRVDGWLLWEGRQRMFQKEGAMYAEACWGRTGAVWMTEKHLCDNMLGKVLWILAVGSG